MSNLHPAAIKAIIFDCDGTLVDNERPHFEAWRQVMQYHGNDFNLEECMACVGRSDYITSLIAAKKIGKDCAKELLLQKNAYFAKRLDQAFPIIAGTIQFIRLLAIEKDQLNLKLAIASASDKHEILSYLRTLQLEHVFDLIVSGQEDLKEYQDPEGVNKPKPYIYLHTAKLLGVLPSECIVIEDSHTGVTASVAAGCITIAIPNELSKNHDLSKATLKLETLTDFTVPSLVKLLFQKLSEKIIEPSAEQ